jgi:hypothetical protein
MVIDFEGEVDRLGAVVFELGKAIDRARDQLADFSETNNADLDPLLYRDANGRYILADLLSSYASSMAAWLTLRKETGDIYGSHYVDS